ncbi:MAG: GNAT family N-acetyltransferase [Actinomycetota bacterium]
MRPSKLLRETVTLKDGRKVVLRPIDPSDAPELIELHKSLSFESQFFRFFGPKPELTAVEADYLANVDFHKRFAIVAEADIGGAKKVVGVGRFDVNEPKLAEAAIVVTDAYQGQGLGTAMLTRMREIGKGAGLDAFTAEVLAENERMLDILRVQGLDLEEITPGVLRVRAPLELPALIKGLRASAQITSAILERLPKPPRIG